MAPTVAVNQKPRIYISTGRKCADPNNQRGSRNYGPEHRDGGHREVEQPFFQKRNAAPRLEIKSAL